MFEIAGGIILACLALTFGPAILVGIFHLLMLPITLINSLPADTPAKPKEVLHTIDPEDEFQLN